MTDEEITDIIDDLPPKTWDVHVWPRSEPGRERGYESGRIDSADVRQLIHAIVEASRA